MGILDKVSDAFHEGWRWLERHADDSMESSHAAPPTFALGGCSAGPIGAPRGFARVEPERDTELMRRRDELAARTCAPLIQYALNYERTCRFFADQCRMQALDEGHYKLSAAGETRATAATYEECLQKGFDQSVTRAPVRSRDLPSIYLPSLGNLMRESCEYLQANAFPLTPGADARADAMLLSKGLLKDGESAREAVSGTVIDAYAAKEPPDEVVIIFADVHSNRDVQNQIARSVLNLRSRGVNLTGVEGVSAGERVAGISAEGMFQKPAAGGKVEIAEISLTPAQCAMFVPSAMMKIACFMGEEEGLVGTESQRLWSENPAEDLFRIAGRGSITAADICTSASATIGTTEVAQHRSYAMIGNLVSIMREKKRPLATLIVGGGHLRDMQILMRHQHISYIMVGVAAYADAAAMISLKGGAGERPSACVRMTSVVDELCK